MFPSFEMLQYLANLGALTQDQVNMYFNGGAINADQVKQLGFSVPNQPTQSASAKSGVNQQSQQATPPTKPNPVAK